MNMKKAGTRSTEVPSTSDSVYCLIYGGVLIWLLPGLIRIGTGRDIAAFVAYAASFYLAAYFLFRLSPRVGIRSIFRFHLGWAIKYFVLLGFVIFPVLHWIHLGGIPLLHAFGSSNYLDVVLIRQRIFENEAPLWSYAISLNVLSILPFFLLLVAVSYRQWFWYLALLGMLYATSLMQKSYAIVIFLPTILYALGQKDFRLSLKLVLLSVAAILTLLLATNPSLRPHLGWLMPSAFAETVQDRDASPMRYRWTAFGERFERGFSGKFASDALYFTGKNAVYLDLSGTEWDIGYDKFSLEFWIRPSLKPSAGHFFTIYWNGAEDGDFRGASYIEYGTRSNGATFLQFNVGDRSGKSSLMIFTRNEVKVNEWNHVYVARDGDVTYLGLNGSLVTGKTALTNLSLEDEHKGLVQFGARFGYVHRPPDAFFQGEIDEISFLRGREIKYTTDYVVPTRPAPIRSLILDDVVDFEPAPRDAGSIPLWLEKYFPVWLVGLIHRIIFVPGEVVGYWFAVIPTELPFAHGCGYRPLATILGCTHVNFSKSVYSLYNRNWVDQGVAGTMNAASFMEDYANFGVPGLIGGGMALAGLLFLTGIAFSGRRQLGIALNIAPLLYLSSSALLSLLFSGGWLTTMLLYAIFYNEFDNCSKDDSCAV